MTVSYLKKNILIPISVLLSLGFFWYTSFAGNTHFSVHDANRQHQQVVQHINCGSSSSSDCPTHYNQAIIAIIPNTQKINQEINKTSDTNPVFLSTNHYDGLVSNLGKQSIFYQDSFLDITLNLNWPVGLARSHLS